MITFQELKQRYQWNSHIPYSELLSTKEWQDRRSEIIKRDGDCCKECGKTETYSSYYGKGRIEHYWLVEKRLWEVRLEDGTYKWIEASETIPSIKPYHLHVHHHYYVLDKQPWEYPDEALVTLCCWCHWEFHEHNKVPVYQYEDRLIQLSLTECQRCNGAGWLPEYKHYHAGICFRCNGKKYEELM